MVMKKTSQLAGCAQAIGIFIIGMVVIAALYKFMDYADYISLSNYQVVMLFQLLFWLIILLAVLAAGANLLRQNLRARKRVSVWMWLAPFLIMVFGGLLSGYMVKENTEGFINKPVMIEGNCSLEYEYRRRGPDGYDILINNKRYDISAVDWRRLGGQRSNCEYGACPCRQPVRLLVLPGPDVVLEVTID
jgi:uncharacterized membrane protein YhaH (DUF805 family)